MIFINYMSNVHVWLQGSGAGKARTWVRAGGESAKLQKPHLFPPTPATFRLHFWTSPLLLSSC